jgi:hypothetical protein
MTISLAFLAPDLVKAAVEGTLPRGIGLTRLADPSLEWAKQRDMLGLWSQHMSRAEEELTLNSPRCSASGSFPAPGCKFPAPGLKIPCSGA